jgi:hypothetical protein
MGMPISSQQTEKRGREREREREIARFARCDKKNAIMSHTIESPKSFAAVAGPVSQSYLIS